MAEQKKQRESTVKLKKRFLEVYAKKNANASLTCRAMKLDRVTYYRWRKEDEKFAAACWEIRDAWIDDAESKLATLVKKGDLGAICFTLKCLGKERGWVERQEHAGVEGQPLQVNVITGINRPPGENA